MFTVIIAVVVILFILNLKDRVANWGVDQTKKDAKTGRFMRNVGVLIVGAIVLASISKSDNNSVKFEGTVGYTLNWPLARIFHPILDFQ